MTAWIRDMLIIITILIFGLVLFGQIPLVWNYNGNTHSFHVPLYSPEGEKLFKQIHPDYEEKKDDKEIQER